MEQPGHAFISYVREDGQRVDRLQQFLEAGGIRVWRDVSSLGPGEDWEAKIRQAIGANSLAFIACFSKNSERRQRTHQRVELLLAINELRERPADRAYLMPVRFDNCKIPDLDIGAGRTLSNLTWVDLYGRPELWHHEAERLLEGIRRILGPAHTGSRPRPRADPPEPPAVSTARRAGRRGARWLSRPRLLLAAVAGAIVFALAAVAAIHFAGGGSGLPAPPPGHRVGDKTGDVSVIVPDAWGDFTGDGWHPRGDIDGVTDGEYIGPGLNASTNIFSWFDDLTTPGLFAGVSKMLVPGYNPSTILSALAPSHCFFASQQPARADGLSGYRDMWTCQNSATRYEFVALWPESHGYIAVLEVKIVTSVDQASANRALASLSIRY